ncbi:hypothetical protein C8R46DRAFT_287819 [Mycena filopes]|nr:hypothetical protein C8R46DRAFT_287819 [Mycena filopes]
MAPSRTQLLSLLVLLTTLSTALNVALYHRVLQASHKLSGPQRHNFEFTSPRELPGYFRPAVLTFAAPATDALHYPLTSDAAWASTVAPKRGFVRLGPAGAPTALATYHQLHCVNGIRFAYVAARDGLFRSAEARRGAFGHVNHCFDLLRQGVLCRADTTLTRVGAEGEGGATTRRCRDWAQVRAFVDENHAFWEGVPYVEAPKAGNRTATGHGYAG